MKRVSKLTLEERLKIKVYLSINKNFSQIADLLNRHRSSIGREVNKWCGKKDFENYDPELAHWYSRDGIQTCQRGEYKLNKYPKLLKLVLKKLIKRWSPQQISGWLKRHYPKNKSMNISHETIYDYIYLVAKGELKKLLISSLRHSKKTRKTRIGTEKHSIRIKDRVSIDDRPKEVNKREVPGHWESDLMIGLDRKTAIGTIVERKTRFTIIVPLKGRGAAEIRRAFSKEMRRLPKELAKTLTHDNGLEMAQHKLFTKETEMQVYFCHPYSSWERGTNENTNGLIRQYWPKGTDFSLLTRRDIKKVQKDLNERPRATLDFATPSEVFEELILNSKS